ncbi:ATP-binding protein [Chitinophaga nivalis]|uniref:AAA family ATPase n=1 Tax=Chitinophaga nivalis TaxID=2991709 RepID=A0ABT3IPM6_9BACT|nr:ATP-binding protein [Chitinophaga nivalis]MCW3464388.1 AAA family ATPase [Chitinophaga nivalis]MCW3485921.1 AAA family ATPase [Chitinophaga nivalis]
MEELIPDSMDGILLAGFRLQYLEVLNWGTFNKVRWQIQPNGHNALLTGDIGSGKSTLVDALTCLLVPHNKIIFNKAAGAEGKERNLLSYVRGEYKKEKEEITKVAKKVYLRPDDNTYTVVIGNFHNQGYGEDICLAQFFWIGKEGKVEKLLVIGTVPLTIKDHFGNFTDITELRKKLRNTEGVQLFNDNFSQYNEHFRRLFGMNSDKAIDLFYQTVSMKSVSSLTDFVREQMLERTDVKDQIATLLKRFDDLNKAHAAVVHAREQYQILKPLTEACIAYGDVTREMEDIEAMMEVMPIWFSEKKRRLLEEAIENETEILRKITQQQLDISTELSELDLRRQSIIQDIANNGGNRIEQIAVEIKRHEQEKSTKRKEFEEYERLASQAGLKSIQDENDFLDNIKSANTLQERCVQLETTLREKRDNLVSELRKQETEYKFEYTELQSLKERKTQIPGWLIGFRTQLCRDLRINEEELPFAGELLKVNEAEIVWEGAIEKLFHDVGMSLLVPQHHYKSVSTYVNDNPLKSADGRGIKLTYLEADLRTNSRVIKELDEDSIVCKVDIKPDTPFYDWLEVYIQRSFGDYICTDVEGLQHVSFGITQKGLIRSGRIRHTKDDRKRIDDRRNYLLGWSNTEKIKVLEDAIHKLEEKIDQLKMEVDKIEEDEKQNNRKKQILDFLLYVKDFSRINWHYHMEKIYVLEQERSNLLNNNDVLAQLQRNKTEVDGQISDMRTKDNQITEEIGALKITIRNFEDQERNAGQQIEQLQQYLKDKWYPLVEEKLERKEFSLKNIDNKQEEFRKQFQGENGELKRLRRKQMDHRSTVERKMREIKEHSRAEYSEIAESIEARAEYINKFEKLASEDLKRHEERFKEELNKNVINSIAVFDSQLQKHELDIKQKIRTINQHLSEIVYNAAQDTYITILMDITTSKEVRLFREELKKCYTHSFSSNNELYTEEKYEQVKRILDRFASMESVDKDWTNTVTDVRKWFEFNASERYRADESEKEFYEGSGGKSGGQKEKLAYTILASALAYQFGLQFGESKSRSFRFVVIDEAFGRGSDESTRYGLELFRKLNLQLLIVTPLQKIHVIENHVNSFHFVSNREGNYSQVNNFSKEAYETEKNRHNGLFKNEGNL